MFFSRNATDRQGVAELVVKPALSRILCAAAALADVSASELATRARMGITRVSQLRSGVRGDIGDVQQLLEALHVRPEALIKHLGRMDDWGSRDLEETLAALLLSFDPEPSPIGTAPARVSCDRLTMTLSLNSRGLTLVETFFDKAKRKPTHGHYKRAGRHRQVFIGDGLRWRGWTGTRIEFNPSRCSPAGIALVASLVAESTTGIRFTRVDVAVDLPVSIRAVQALGTRSKKAAAVWSDSIETIYVGHKNGARSFAIYDKRNELLRHGHRSPLGDETRFEARLRKIKLKPVELLDVENPFLALQLLWLGGDDLTFLDRILVRLARVAGLPLLLNELPAKRFARLRQKLADEARKRGVPHPRDAFDEAWRPEAERVLDVLGLR